MSELEKLTERPVAYKKAQSLPPPDSAVPTLRSSDGPSPGVGTIFAASKMLSSARRARMKMRRTSSGMSEDQHGQEPGAARYQSIDEEKEERGGDDNGQAQLVRKASSAPLAKHGDLALLWDMLTGKAINWLLVFVPVAVASAYMGWSDTAVFSLNFIAMIPLASMLGDFTEEVAAHTSQTVGGLINATLGNAVEIVVGLQALYANEIRVVQASMLGSVFSNMLLVLGCCFFFGGLKFNEQTFNSTSAVANMSLLLLSSLALVLPAPLALAKGAAEEDSLLISRFTGVFLLLMYVQLLIFQFKTHSHLFEDEDEEEGSMSMTTACIALAVVTVAVSILSEFLVDSIDGFTVEANLSKTFVGIILLPIIGNAVEHVTAITVAVKDKMELAMGVAVGSATQVAMFVVPVMVLAGWGMGRDMSLAFPVEEIMLYLLSIIIVSTAVSNGSSNWLMGSLLVTTYILVAVAFWFEKVETI